MPCFVYGRRPLLHANPNLSPLLFPTITTAVISILYAILKKKMDKHAVRFGLFTGFVDNKNIEFK